MTSSHKKNKSHSSYIQNVNTYNKQLLKPKETARQKSSSRGLSLKASYFIGH